jgi:hypothetical protein
MQRYSLNSYLRLADEMDKLERTALELNRFFINEGVGKTIYTKYSIPLNVGLQKVKCHLDELVFKDYPEINEQLLVSIFYGHHGGKWNTLSTERRQAVQELARKQKKQRATSSHL